MDTDSLKTLIPLAAITRLAAFEVQRWAQAIGNGKRGASEGFSAFVLLSNLLATMTYYGWLVGVGFKIGVAEATSIFVASMAVGTLVGTVTGPDRFWKWLLGLAMIWPLTITLYAMIFYFR